MKSFALFSCILWLACAAACAQFRQLSGLAADALEARGRTALSAAMRAARTEDLG